MPETPTEVVTLTMRVPYERTESGQWHAEAETIDHETMRQRLVRSAADSPTGFARVLAEATALAEDLPTCPNCAPGYDCERGIYHPTDRPSPPPPPSVAPEHAATTVLGVALNDGQAAADRAAEANSYRQTAEGCYDAAIAWRATAHTLARAILDLADNLADPQELERLRAELADARADAKQEAENATEWLRQAIAAAGIRLDLDDARDEIENLRNGARSLITTIDRLADEANAHEGEMGDLRAKLTAAETEVDDLRARGAELEAEAVGFAARLGFGDNVSDPAAPLSDMVDPIADAMEAARDHDECPINCGLCGETLAATVCQRCGGGGNIGTTAWEDCHECAGDGRIHEGCVGKSYADLAARVAELEQMVTDRSCRMCGGSHLVGGGLTLPCPACDVDGRPQPGWERHYCGTTGAQPGRWELPAGIEWDMVRWHCTRCGTRSTWLGMPSRELIAGAVEKAERHHADHERWDAERLSATPPETARCAHSDRRCDPPNALCVVDCTPPETAGGEQDG